MRYDNAETFNLPKLITQEFKLSSFLQFCEGHSNLKAVISTVHFALTFAFDPARRRRYGWGHAWFANDQGRKYIVKK